MHEKLGGHKNFPEITLIQLHKLKLIPHRLQRFDEVFAADDDGGREVNVIHKQNFHHCRQVGEDPLTSAHRDQRSKTTQRAEFTKQKISPFFIQKNFIGQK